MKSLPESGMGYQNVIIKLKSGTVLRGVVVNCEILQVVGYHLFNNDDIDEMNLS